VPGTREKKRVRVADLSPSDIASRKVIWLAIRCMGLCAS
jgi:hypothetical protein